jgi:cell wall-associated NlpC family hydrolase
MWYRPGDVVRVTVKGGILHEGIMTEHGRVISNSRRRGGVFEESTRDFSGGRKIRNIGPLSKMNPENVLARARARIGTPYNASSFNCQHFVRECYGLGRSSPQKKILVGAGVLAAIAAIF